MARNYNYEKMNTDKFRAFLEAFGVKWWSEFITLSDDQKAICVREFFKDLPNLLHKNNLQQWKNYN